MGDEISQEELLGGFDFDVLEASLDEGQTRADEPDADVQCSVFTDRGRKGSYKLQAILKTCIHGVLDQESKTPASLIVIDYSLKNIKYGGRFTSATTSFNFALHRPEDEGEASESAGLEDPRNTPHISAYAPFEKPIQWEETTADKSKTDKVEIELAPEAQGFKAGKIAYSHESSSAQTQRYFQQGLAGRHFLPPGSARNVADKVWWNLQNNQIQKSNIPPEFRVAILLTRRIEVAEQKFQARFEIAIRGGIGFKLSELTDRFLRRNVADKPVVFNPKVQFIGEELDGLKPNDNGVYELGHLAKGRELVKLTSVWGLSPLEPGEE